MNRHRQQDKAGTFVMSSRSLEKLFPRTSGYDLFLVDVVERIDSDEEKLAETFSGYGPSVSSTDELARENLGYELSYLFLFRDFLVIGIVTAMVSAIAFIHSKAVSMRREMEVLRAIGVRRRRAVSYLTVENLVLFLSAVLGSFSAMTIANLSFIDDISGGSSLADSLYQPAAIGLLILIISAAISLISSLWSLGEYRTYVRRRI